MWAVWRHYGGGHLSIPLKAAEGHCLTAAVGPAHAAALCGQFAGETLYIPKFDAVQKAARAARNTVIKQQRQQSMGLFEIARAHNLSERQVINILGQDTQVSNFDLFD